jgi:PBSX family phage terminase large subunit
MTLRPDFPLSQRQIDSVAHSDGRVNVWEGAIRSGKTFSSELRWLMHVADAPAGGELVMVGKTLQSLYRNVFTTLMNADLFGPLAAEVHYTPGATTAVILGRVVHCIGANDAKAESKIRGFTCAGAYVDEASLVPREFWNTLLGRMSVAGAKLFATTNPDNPAHWLRQDVLMAGDPDLRAFKFKITDNPSNKPEYIEWIKRQYVGLYYRRFINGEWVAAEGAVYDMWDPDRHVVDIVPAISQWIAVGIDYGTSNPFHAVLLGLGVDSRMYAASEYRYDGRRKRRQLTDAEYVERMAGWLADPPGTRYTAVTPSWFVVDPSAASFKAELRRAQATAMPAKNDVLDGIRTVSTLLAKDKLRVSRIGCPNLIDEFGGYSWDDKAALLGEDKPIKVADHGLDGLRYGVFTTRGVWRTHLGVDLAA